MCNKLKGDIRKTVKVTHIKIIPPIVISEKRKFDLVFIQYLQLLATRVVYDGQYSQ